MKKVTLVVWLVIISAGLSACGNPSADQTGPEIKDIETSGKVLVISDCQGTSVTISAKVTDPSGVESVLLWYRVADQPFASASMKLQDGVYQVVVIGSEFLGKGYGTLEFYIQAKDGAGNLSKSPLDQIINSETLLCFIMATCIEILVQVAFSLARPGFLLSKPGFIS